MSPTCAESSRPHLVDTRPLGWLMSVLAVALVAVVALIAAPRPAYADGNKIRIEFVGFGSNPDFYAVVHKDKLAGDTLAVYQVAVPAAVAVVALEGTNKSKALKSPELAPYAIQTSGHVSDVKAPQGWGLFAAQVGAQLQLGLTDGKAQSTLGYVALSTDSSGMESAAAKVTSVHWSADGSRVVVIYNESLDDGEYELDSDRLAAYTLALPAAPAPAEEPKKEAPKKKK